jgi:hypothetical protein
LKDYWWSKPNSFCTDLVFDKVLKVRNYFLLQDPSLLDATQLANVANVVKHCPIPLDGSLQVVILVYFLSS